MSNEVIQICAHKVLTFNTDLRGTGQGDYVTKCFHDDDVSVILRFVRFLDFCLKVLCEK